MLVLFIFGFIAAVIGTIFIVFANGMSDAPQQDFQGSWMIIGAWVCVAILGLGWWFG